MRQTERSVKTWKRQMQQKQQKLDNFALALSKLLYINAENRLHKRSYLSIQHSFQTT